MTEKQQRMLTSTQRRETTHNRQTLRGTLTLATVEVESTQQLPQYGWL